MCGIVVIVSGIRITYVRGEAPHKVRLVYAHMCHVYSAGLRSILRTLTLARRSQLVHVRGRHKQTLCDLRTLWMR